MKTVEEVCGLSSKEVASPRKVGREREIEERIEGITERVRRRNERVGRSMKLTVDEFKNHFESVSRDRYEERPELIERAVRGAVHLRNDSRAKEANECLNVVHESEEIREAMKETRESAPGLE